MKDIIGFLIFAPMVIVIWLGLFVFVIRVISELRGGR